MRSLNLIVATMVGTILCWLIFSNILVPLSSATGGRALLQHWQAYGASNEAVVPNAPIFFGGRRALLQHGRVHDDISNKADVTITPIFDGGRALLQQGRVPGATSEVDVPNTPILGRGRALLQDSPPYLPNARISGGKRAKTQHDASSIYGWGRALLQYERENGASNKATVPNAPNFAGGRTMPEVAYVPPSAPSPCTYIPSIGKNDCDN